MTTYKDSIDKGKTPIAIDPYNVLGKYADFDKYRITQYDPLNPNLDLSDPLDKEQYVDSMVDALTNDAKYEGGNHFRETAEAILGAIIEDHIGTGKTLVNLYDKFAPLSQAETIQELQAIYDITRSRRAIGAAGLLGKVAEEEAGSMLSTLYRSFDYVASTAWSKFLSKVQLDMNKMIDEKVDLFLIVPLKMVKKYPKVIRMIFSMFLVHFDLADPKKLLNRKFQIFLDEAAQLKSNREIEQIIEIYGENFAQLWMISAVESIYSTA